MRKQQMNYCQQLKVVMVYCYLMLHLLSLSIVVEDLMVRLVEVLILHLMDHLKDVQLLIEMVLLMEIMMKVMLH